MFFSIVIAITLESIVNGIVLQSNSSGIIPLKTNPILFMIYAGLMAGLFEESSRFFLLKIFAKNRAKYSNVKTGLSYGLGHGIAESVLLVGIGFICNGFLFCFQ